MKNPFLLRDKETRTAEPYSIGHPAYLKVSGQDTNGQISFLVGTFTKGNSAPLHKHNMDETFYILEGEFLFQVGDKKYQAYQGDTVFIPRNLPHSYLTLSETGKSIFMLNPASFTEELFAKLSTFKEPPTKDEVDEMQKDFGLEIVGPPLTF